jgi:predicted dehydrogenase
MNQVRIAVAGAGMIGKRHIEEIDASDSAVLASIVDATASGGAALWRRRHGRSSGHC